VINSCSPSHDWAPEQPTSGNEHQQTTKRWTHRQLVSRPGRSRLARHERIFPLISRCFRAFCGDRAAAGFGVAERGLSVCWAEACPPPIIDIAKLLALSQSVSTTQSTKRKRERKKEKRNISLFLFSFFLFGSGTYPPHPRNRGRRPSRSLGRPSIGCRILVWCQWVTAVRERAFWNLLFWQ